MTDPTHARQVPGKGRWYFHPNGTEQWPSVTNVLDTCVAKPALVPWAAKVTAGKAWDYLPRMLAASLDDDAMDEITRELKAEVKIAKDMAADLGTRVHALVEAKALGKPMPDDPEAAPFVDQALQFFTDFGIDLTRDVESAEATVINRAHGYAGTGDLLAHMRNGRKRELWWVDYKTSLTRPVGSVYIEYGLQLAAIAAGEHVLFDDGTEEPCPGPIAGAAVLNLRTGAYALIPMPFDQDLDAALAAFVGALQVANYVHARHGEKPTAVTAPTRKAAA